MSHKTKFFTVIGTALLFLILFAAVKEYSKRRGEKILLKIVPVDPRDFFRGDYVILRYEISQIDLNKVVDSFLPIDDNLKKRLNVYVILQKNTKDKFWSAKSISTNPPKKKDEIFIKGKIVNAEDNLVEIEYGIESYFVEEGKGIELERERDRKNMYAEVSVGEFGNAIINRIFVGDKPI